MISIIICSTTKTLSGELTENIDSTIGVPYELICIDNSEGKYSICQAYNKGIELARHPYLLFVHQDVVFQTTDWGKHLITHLQQPDAGIIGMVGAQIVPRIPQEAWVGYNLGEHFIQGNSYSTRKAKLHYLPENYNEKLYPVVCMDGMFLAMRKELTEKIHFDENIPGFHTYDIDICLQATQAGYVNYVAYDILLTHNSSGQINQNYYQQLINTYRKWQDHLPMTVPALRNETTIIQKAELKQLRRLQQKLINKRFSVHSVIQLTYEYTQLIDCPLSQWEKIKLRTWLYYQLTDANLRHLYRWIETQLSH